MSTPYADPATGVEAPVDLEEGEQVRGSPGPCGDVRDLDVPLRKKPCHSRGRQLVLIEQDPAVDDAVAPAPRSGAELEGEADAQEDDAEHDDGTEKTAPGGLRAMPSHPRRLHRR